MSSTEVNQTDTPKQKSTVRAVLLTSALSLAGVLAFLVVHEVATLPARVENRQLLAKIQAMDDANFEKSGYRVASPSPAGEKQSAPEPWTNSSSPKSAQAPWASSYPKGSVFILEQDGTSARLRGPFTKPVPSAFEQGAGKS